MTDQQIKQIIIQEVCRYYNQKHYKLGYKCQKREVVEPRQVIHYLCKKFTKLSLTDIGMIYQQGHATVINSLRHINNLMFRNGLDKIINKLTMTIQSQINNNKIDPNRMGSY